MTVDKSIPLVAPNLAAPFPPITRRVYSKAFDLNKCSFIKLTANDPAPSIKLEQAAERKQQQQAAEPEHAFIGGALMGEGQEQRSQKRPRQNEEPCQRHQTS